MIPESSQADLLVLTQPSAAVISIHRCAFAENAKHQPSHDNIIISRGRSHRERSPTAKFPTSIWLQHCGGGGNRYFLFADELGMRGTLPSYGLIDFHLPYLQLQWRCKCKLTSGGERSKTVVGGHAHAVSALASSQWCFSSVFLKFANAEEPRFEWTRNSFVKVSLDISQFSSVLLL